MAATKENLVKKRVKEMLDEMGVYHFSPVQNGMGSSGVPDIVCCLNGFFIGIECKKDAKTAPTALQTQHAEDIKKRKGVVFLANGANTQELGDLLSRINGYSYGVNWDSLWPFSNPAPFDKW
jgi:hypothetical protein